MFMIMSDIYKTAGCCWLLHIALQVATKFQVIMPC